MQVILLERVGRLGGLVWRFLPGVGQLDVGSHVVGPDRACAERKDEKQRQRQ